MLIGDRVMGDYISRTLALQGARASRFLPGESAPGRQGWPATTPLPSLSTGNTNTHQISPVRPIQFKFSDMLGSGQTCILSEFHDDRLIGAKVISFYISRTLTRHADSRLGGCRVRWTLARQGWPAGAPLPSLSTGNTNSYKILSARRILMKFSTTPGSA